MWSCFDTAAAALRVTQYRVIGGRDICGARPQGRHVVRYGGRFPFYGSFGHGVNC